jgi:hypothetical protein
VGILESGTLAEGSKCGRKVRAFLDNGGVFLICTLDSGHGGAHYDDVFLTPWKEIEKNTDS